MKRERHEHNNHIENEEENNNNDIISDLPDSVLLHILSFLKTKDAVKTCILSTRWKNLWKHLSILTLYSSHFKTLRDFFKFVSRILFLRDDSTAIHTLDLHRRGIIEPHLLKKIIKYAVSHNVQQLEIDVGCDIQHFPTCLFSCQTLTSLHLYVRHRISGQRTLFPNSLNLPSLTNLSLDSFAFPIENDGRANPFSAMKRLNNLIIDDCIVLDAQKLCISSDRLTDLTIQTTFERCFCEIELSTPSLCTFDFIGIPYQKLRGSHLSSIKQVNFDANIMENPTKPPSVLLSWLLELTGIKSLRVTSTTLQVYHKRLSMLVI